MHRQAIGIDIGGSSIKAAVVDLHARRAWSANASPSPRPRCRRSAKCWMPWPPRFPTTPGICQQASPFPVSSSAEPCTPRPTSPRAWIGQPLAEPAAAKLKRQVVAINDADAAGLAEVQFGAARDVHGTVLVLEPRHRHRQRAVRRRQARAQHRARPPRVRRHGSRSARVRPRAHGAQTRLGRLREGAQLRAAIACTHCSGRISSCCAAASPPIIRISATTSTCRAPLKARRACARMPASSAPRCHDARAGRVDPAAKGCREITSRRPSVRRGCR